MTYTLDDFDYDLPKEFIAQSAAEPRDSSRLLVIHRSDGRLEHRIFRDLPESEPRDSGTAARHQDP
jgi:S-adenosylmethionine:tRNA ribosyltransferase-isomerase